MVKIENRAQSGMAVFVVKVGMGLGLTPKNTAEAVRVEGLADCNVGKLITHAITGEANAQALNEVADEISRRRT